MPNRSHRRRRHQSFEEELERSVRLEHFFENLLKDSEAKFMKVCAELKTALKARTKIASLDLDILSPTIILKKKVTR